jgi:hypothetical protein
MRYLIALLAAALLLSALPRAIEAQQIKLKDKGIKGTLTTASCTGPIGCQIKDLGATAPDLFLYVTQVCLHSSSFAATVIARAVGSGVLAAAQLTPHETRCFTYEPARLVAPNDVLQCTESANTAAGCAVTGVLSNK